ncbi:alpha/beta hydrolase [Flavipsychrobacter stenotrophus]|uniref:Alpha/beta hydrolase n=1 Tax=Flavipsychrobacter stenotrophus TaxID=2077091 RepID=A0A2S7SPB0_9BACT|nr:alpha/beta hydrolase [Flavipsychrobacter stenotrophus]PQJ08732.1 alpha/beta hydrolase [Flavipsychrobacter stenotrophus]
MKLLFLHGAIGASDQMLPLAQMLATQYDVYTPDFYGHGGQNMYGNLFSIPLFAECILKYMDEAHIERASIFGYSMGGYVAMYLAKHHPEKVDKVITLATKYHWDVETATKEVKMLDPEKIEQKLPQFASSLKARHTATGWGTVLARTEDMMMAMGADNPLKKEGFAQIQQKILVAIGDRDKMVSMEETISVYKALPTAQLCIIPDTGHPIEQLDVSLAATIFSRFLSQ